VHDSAPPPAPTSGSVLSVAVLEAMPDAGYLPQQAVVASGTKYVVIQPNGGSALLGPILGSMSIAHKTRKMANENEGDSIFAIDPTSVASDAVAEVGVSNKGIASAFDMMPFVFAQYCDDGKFRLSLVFQVQSNQASLPWIGRYTYDLPTVYDASRFNRLTSQEIANYRIELAEGAKELADLMQRDLEGKLPEKGRSVHFGSLYLVGSKMGGMGIYSKPEKLYFPAQLIEETSKYVTVRLNGHMHNTLMGGGLAFGVHRTDRNLVHTLTDVN